MFSFQGYAVLDGGFSTSLESTGYALDRALWSGYAAVDNTDGVTSVHRQYLEAGADIITTCSYQMSFEGFATKDISTTDAGILYQTATNLAVGAVASHACPALVAASVGTFGAHLSDGSEYVGRYGRSLHELVDWHRPKFEILASSGADILACETVPCIDEMRAFQQLLLEDSIRGTHTSSWISMACRSSTELNSGEKIEDALRALEDPSSEGSMVYEKAAAEIAIGVNCTAPVYVKEIAELISETCPKGKVIVVYPNSGERWDGAARTWLPGAETTTVEEVFDDKIVLSWRESGASVIGGCCRCTPKTIAGIRKTLSK